jgi:hypothetical protein
MHQLNARAARVEALHRGLSHCNPKSEIPNPKSRGAPSSSASTTFMRASSVAAAMTGSKLRTSIG